MLIDESDSNDIWGFILFFPVYLGYFIDSVAGIEEIVHYFSEINAQNLTLLASMAALGIGAYMRNDNDESNDKVSNFFFIVGGVTTAVFLHLLTMDDKTYKYSHKFSLTTYQFAL